MSSQTRTICRLAPIAGVAFLTATQSVQAHSLETTRAMPLSAPEYVQVSATAPAVSAAPGPPMAPQATSAQLEAADGPAGGHMLFAALGPASSPAEALKAGLHLVHGYFDRSPELLNGIDDKDGSVRLVLFTAELHGAPVVGVAVATSDEAAGARIGFLFDSPDRFAKSIGAMQQQLNKIALAAAMQAHPLVSASGDIDIAQLLAAAKLVELTEVQFPDGTASFGIARGYTTRSAQMAAFYVEAPDGAVLNCGGGISILDPRGATYQSWLKLMAMTPNFHATFPGPVFDYIADPAEAWVAARRTDAQLKHQPDPQIRLTLATPLQIVPDSWGRKGALVSGTEVINGTPMVFFGTVMSSRPTPEGSWTITVSVIHAPIAQASADLPALWAMRQSLQIDVAQLARRQREIMQRMHEEWTARMNAEHEAFMASMNERYQHAQAAASASRDATDRMVAATVRYLGDKFVVEYKPTGEHDILGTKWGRTLVDEFPDVFRVIPLTEYVKGVDY